MRIAETVFRRAAELGITLRVDGDFVEYSPKSKAPPDFVATLRDHKPELLEHLRQQHEPEPQVKELRRRKPKVISHLAQDLIIEAEIAELLNCGVCGANEWWPRHDGNWVCGVCHPQPPKPASRLR